MSDTRRSGVHTSASYLARPRARVRVGAGARGEGVGEGVSEGERESGGEGGDEGERESGGEDGGEGEAKHTCSSTRTPYIYMPGRVQGSGLGSGRIAPAQRLTAARGGSGGR